jgi:PAT family beta-lactamase induction signal transducer AmpG
MAACMLVGVGVTLVAREPHVDQPPPKTLTDAVVLPFVDFFRRKDALVILAFILLYKVGDQMASSMTTPFVLELGFTKTDLARVAKVFGMGSMIAGSLVAGVLMLWTGIRRALWLFGVAQAVAILAFAGLAHAGKVEGWLILAVTSENLTAGMGSAAYSAYMASLTNRRFTATQFALFSSLMGVPRVLLAAPTGYVASGLGWTSYFVFCAAAAIPGLLLLSVVAPWRSSGEQDPPQAVAESA